jgi:hypothetical protein
LIGIPVIKTLALPKLIHLLTSLPNLKQSLFIDLNKQFFNIIWDGKPEKIKRNTLIAEFEDGGLKMIHLQQLKFRSGIELRSREKSISCSLKLDTDQFNLKSGQRI